MDNTTLPPFFDINHDSKVMFPSPERQLGSLVVDTDSYLAAMRSSMGDVVEAVKSNIIEAAKALGANVPPSAYSFATLSMMPDSGNSGLLPWPGIAPESLRKIRQENIAPQLVIRSRVADLARYSRLSTHLWEPGWQVALRDARKTPSTQDMKDVRDGERFIWNCSMESSYTDPERAEARERDAHHLSNFEQFLRQFGDDTHTYDGWAVWTDMTRDGKVRAFANLPASNIRLTVPGKGFRGDTKFFAALVDDTGNPVRAFTPGSLVLAVRTPPNDAGEVRCGLSRVAI